MHRTEKRPQRLRAIRVPKGVSEPRGSRERLTAAVRRLAPHKGVWIKDDGSKQILSEELAIELLDSLARRYNTNTYLTAHAERYSSIDRRLKKLATHAAVLANDLSDLGELTATVIFNEALRSCRSKARSKIIERADIKAILPQGRRSSLWARRASNLSRTFMFVREALAADRRRWGRSEKDRGGKVNHFTEDAGTPQWGLFTDALYIYEGFKPGKAKGTDDGDLHLFVDELLEYATGKEPRNSTIRPLRDLLVATRKQNDLAARCQALTRKMEEFTSLNASNPDVDLRPFVELNEEFTRTQEAFFKLNRETWPHKPTPWLD